MCQLSYVKAQGIPLSRGGQMGLQICLQDAEQLPCWLLAAATDLTLLLGPVGAPQVLEISTAICRNLRLLAPGFLLAAT